MYIVRILLLFRIANELPNESNFITYNSFIFFDSDLFTNKQPAIFERAVQGVTKAVEKLSLTLPINVLKEKSLIIFVTYPQDTLVSSVPSR